MGGAMSAENAQGDLSDAQIGRQRRRQYKCSYYQTKVKGNPAAMAKVYAAQKAYRLRRSAEPRMVDSETLALTRLARKAFSRRERSEALRLVRRRVDPAAYAARKLCRRAKSTAAFFSVPYTLDEADIARRIKAGVCEASGTVMKPEHIDGGPHCPRLMRRSAKRGFTQDNVLVVASSYMAGAHSA